MNSENTSTSARVDAVVMPVLRHFDTLKPCDFCDKRWTGLYVWKIKFCVECDKPCKCGHLLSTHSVNGCSRCDVNMCRSFIYRYDLGTIIRRVRCE